MSFRHYFPMTCACIVCEFQKRQEIGLQVPKIQVAGRILLASPRLLIYGGVTVSVIFLLWVFPPLDNPKIVMVYVPRGVCGVVVIVRTVVAGPPQIGVVRS